MSSSKTTPFAFRAKFTYSLLQVNLPRNCQHGHLDCPDYEPGTEAGQRWQSLTIPGGQQEKWTLCKVCAINCLVYIFNWFSLENIWCFTWSQMWHHFQQRNSVSSEHWNSRPRGHDRGDSQCGGCRWWQQVQCQDWPADWLHHQVNPLHADNYSGYDSKFGDPVYLNLITGCDHRCDADG